MNKKNIIIAIAVLFSIGAAAQTFPYQNPELSAEQRAEDLCKRLTLEEKASLMMSSSPAIPRLGIPQFDWWNEVLHGVARNGFATVFPATIGMAASFDDQLLQKVFDAAGDEARAKANTARHSGVVKRYQSLSFWTPNINIFRDPRWGRGQETYGEDPFLTERMGLAVVRGLQGDGTHRYRKLLACAKHFAVHSGPEWNRHEFNVESLPERDLWETYLPAFKALVQDGKVAEVMCAYQRIDGDPCCGNTRYLQHILRDEWDFDGLVTSDCGAVDDFWRPGRHGVSKNRHEASAKAVRSGTDVECGSNYVSLPEAVANGEVTEAEIDVSLKRLLKARFELGDFDPESLVDWQRMDESVVASREHKQLALQMARESMTLLHNRNNALPLNRNERVIVMGPNANDSVMQWANYSGYPTTNTTILQGIRKKLGRDVKYYVACDLTRDEVQQSLFACLSTPEGTKGLKATYYNNMKFNGEPAAVTVVTEPINLSNGGNTVFAPGVNLEKFSARYEGVFQPEKDEEVTFTAKFDDGVRLLINGDTLFNVWNGRARIQVAEKTFRVKAGQAYRLQLDYKQDTDLGALQFDIIRKMQPTKQQLLQQAEGFSTVVFVGGISPRLEGEEMKVDAPGFKGGDRTDIQLPHVQRDVLKALHEAGKKVIFVNCSGSAIALTRELETTDAILQAWYPGEEGGNAVADVLFGDYNPEGKLPITFYKSVNDLPDFLDYRMDNRTYRYFTGEALFPFGYGLSYTSFNISKPTYKNGKVTVSVANTGKLRGSETVQVYLKRIGDKGKLLKTLRGFKKVTLNPGETQQVVIDMPRERFESWDDNTNTMRIIPGKYLMMVGNSSDANALKTITVKVK
ncbi:MAG: glycoside hydrolase family 3 C-terminal domain-containing protein [Prevotella sp.]|nr:glycoside hydrolase family 3 C-terminal domain-containing protein [Prevotella sp.]